MSDERRPSPFVRPYAVTGGRTQSRYELALEALVSTTARAWDASTRLTPDQWTICRLCTELKSVAEVSALLNMPLGVTRVLVGDLAESGVVSVAQPGHAGGRPDLTLLERVLVGLRSL